MADKPETLDAVLVPQNYPPGKHGRDRLAAITAEFGPRLGLKLVHCHPLPDNSLLCGKAGNHRYHAGDHPLAGQERYDWFDRGDGVQYGRFNAEAAEADAAKAEADRTKSTADKIAAKAKESAARLTALKAVPEADRTPQETAELSSLTRWADVFGGQAAAAPAGAPSATTQEPEHD